LGGLGSIFAEHLAKRYSAKLILTGRAALDAGKEERLEGLERAGAEVLYVAAEVSDKEQMRSALAQGRERFGALHGVIHAAGIVSDRRSVLAKDVGSIEAVLAPKVTGSIVLNELLQDAKLDFLCYFSSSAAILGDFGACDYAVGNRFELAYAQHASPHGVAICWPMWAQGSGVKDDAAQLYLRTSGQRALRAEEGVEIFEQLLARHGAGELRHAIVMVGERERVYRLVGLGGESVTADVPTEKISRARRPELRGLSIEQCVLWEVQTLASELLKLPRERLEAQENLAEFGFDSIGLATFARRLSTYFGIEVLPNVFFSYPTLRQLAEYLLTEHGKALQQYYADQTAMQPSAARRGRVDRVRGESRSSDPITLLTNQPSPASGADRPEPIAIIGMSGRFPGARSVDELWRMLASGQEAVQEIPPERFDWREYYQTPSTENEATPALDGKSGGKWLGVLPGVEEFDPLFFEVSPKEAALMDPRQRLLLQESFKALEEAGYG
ncbi:MAG: SDR family NAD(P)-dependent oxidoreductase, partial [Chthoniobacterales bacterium]